jgi:threonine dehydrogenase-like Zn-dependent dehydrogenase
MRAVEFKVTIPGFLLARSLGRINEAAVFGGLSGVSLVERTDPELLGPDWVRLKVLASGICGTDIGNLTFAASPILEPFGSFPAVLGHEILAEVEAVGPVVRRVRPGDRVAVDPMISCAVRGHPPDAVCPSCRAGRHSTCEMAGEEGTIQVREVPLRRGLTIGYHADLPGGWGERMIAHESQLFPLDPAISDRAAVMIEPLSIAVHAILNAPPREADDVLVIGSGPIAFSAIWALRALGFPGTIVAQTKRDSEAELARALGATEVVKPGNDARDALVGTGARAYQPIVGEEVFSGGGFPYLLDCVGSAGSLAQALRYASPRGRVVVLGCAAQVRKLDLTLLWARELEVRGFVGYGRERWRGEERHTFEVTERLLLESELPVDRMVTHHFPLSQYRAALSAAANRRRSGAVKVVLTPNGELG